MSLAESFFWVPFINENVLSVIDGAPLSLVQSYLDDVSIVLGAIDMTENKRMTVQAHDTIISALAQSHVMVASASHDVTSENFRNFE
ncbi:hypothetical protein Tco_0851703 [Tanacetum coccineum]